MSSTLNITDLPAEALVSIGRSLPDVKSVVALCKTCRTFRILLPEILTTDWKKLQESIRKLFANASVAQLTTFLEHCERSPHRNAPFYLAGERFGAIHKIDLIRRQFPNLTFTNVPERPVAYVCAPPPSPPPPRRDLLLLCAPPPPPRDLSDIYPLKIEKNILKAWEAKFQELKRVTEPSSWKAEEEIKIFTLDAEKLLSKQDSSK